MSVAGVAALGFYWDSAACFVAVDACFPALAVFVGAFERVRDEWNLGPFHWGARVRIARNSSTAAFNSLRATLCPG